MIPLSDFKQIVKESLREAFYSKKDTLNESLVGKTISIEVWGQLGTHGTSYAPYIKYPAVIGKNTIPHEKPYRLSWFSPDKQDALGHIDMTPVQFNKLMNGIDDEEVYKKFAKVNKAERIHFNLNDDETQTSLVAEITEEQNVLLLLLEDSAREIDLWLENKR